MTSSSSPRHRWLQLPWLLWPILVFAFPVCSSDCCTCLLMTIRCKSPWPFKSKQKHACCTPFNMTPLYGLTSQHLRLWLTSSVPALTSYWSPLWSLMSPPLFNIKGQRDFSNCTSLHPQVSRRGRRIQDSQTGGCSAVGIFATFAGAVWTH